MATLLPGATPDPEDGTLLRCGARRVRVVLGGGLARGRSESWTFGDAVFEADAVLFADAKGARLLIARDELEAMLPDLHCAADGWSLVLQHGRLLKAEWGLGAAADCWEPARLLARWGVASGDGREA